MGLEARTGNDKKDILSITSFFNITADYWPEYIARGLWGLSFPVQLSLHSPTRQNLKMFNRRTEEGTQTFRVFYDL